MRKLIIRWRIFILVLLAAILVIFEFIEHRSFFAHLKPESLIEIGVYFFLLAIIGLLIEAVIVANAEKDRAIHTLDTRHRLSQQLTTVRDWEDLLAQVLQYPASMAPVLGTSLLMYDPAVKQYQSTHSWVLPQEGITIPSLTLPEPVCLACLNDLPNSGLHRVSCEASPVTSGGRRLCYCLPLSYGNMPAGMLYIYLPEEQPLTPDQSQLLDTIASEIGFALVAYRQRREWHTVEVSNAVNAERLGIARDLHDTLGQNLGYLHFKLDQILNEPQRSSLDQAAPELEKLRELANESYELVRGTLILLHRSDEHPINHLLKVYAQIIADRAGFTIDMQAEGPESTFPPKTVHTFSFVFQEALRNIEKHAGASQVKVLLTWAQDSLTVRIDDDGCGFDLQKTIRSDHYGLRIMRERMANMGGRFEVQSSPGQGTHILLRLPVEI